MYKNKSKSCKFKKTEKEKTMKRQAKQKKFNPDHLAFIERLKSLESQSADKVNCSHFCNEFNMIDSKLKLMVIAFQIYTHLDTGFMHIITINHFLWMQYK